MLVVLVLGRGRAALDDKTDDEYDGRREHQEDGILAARKNAAAEADPLAELLVEEVRERDHDEDVTKNATVQH